MQKTTHNKALVKEIAKNIRLRAACPIHHNAEIKITRKGFIRMCNGFRSGAFIKRTGSVNGKQSCVTNYACKGCKTGDDIVAGKKFTVPSNVTFISIPKEKTRQPKRAVSEGLFEVFRYTSNTKRRLVFEG